MVAVYLGLGSNLGERWENMARAVERLAEEMSIERVSSSYETEPVGYLEQPCFLNAVLRAETNLMPRRLLDLIKAIETDLGRVPSFPNAPRPIDIDILFYGDEVIQLPDLVVPHPRIAERAFVLVPLAEIAAELVHPGTRRTVAEMLAEVPGREGVERSDYPPLWHEEGLCTG